MNKISLCNEVISGRGRETISFAVQCQMAAEMGYGGLEVAPFTLCNHPSELSSAKRTDLLRTAKSFGLEITGLHWLLVSPDGLSITSTDPNIWNKTLDVIKATIDLCSDLEANVLVHGSPAQRQLPLVGEVFEAQKRALDLWAAAGEFSERKGVTYCIEPLSRGETSFVNTVEDAVEIVQKINLPALQTMIDTSAAGLTETTEVADLINYWVPKGNIAHVQLNSTNRGAPGDGDDPFYDILKALKDTKYQGVIAVEPFIYKGGGQATAKRAIDYLKGVLKDINANLTS
jgi:sugar phosphate isomerase/epimerase|tara:strand:+ start:10929 stop:11792 length:864 start_codon:yes stop_codon:yes gene_type:complete